LEDAEVPRRSLPKSNRRYPFVGIEKAQESPVCSGRMNDFQSGSGEDPVQNAIEVLLEGFESLFGAVGRERQRRAPATASPALTPAF
jgi:hypothetical protein